MRKQVSHKCIQDSGSKMTLQVVLRYFFIIRQIHSHFTFALVLVPE